MDFENIIKPFFWIKYDDGSYSLCLNVGEYKCEMFEDLQREGNGYDWESFANWVLNEYLYDLKGSINFDPEADMFCAYSKSEENLKRFALLFKEKCEVDDAAKNLSLAFKSFYVEYDDGSKKLEELHQAKLEELSELKKKYDETKSDLAMIKYINLLLDWFDKQDSNDNMKIRNKIKKDILTLFRELHKEVSKFQVTKKYMKLSVMFHMKKLVQRLKKVFKF